ncbi:MAG: sulfite exporter TauE/SafE family protein [Gallionellaceae bacterium]|nr:sulfite exporter TauE/SafE family protein [Gallionellaceae bacterium]
MDPYLWLVMVSLFSTGLMSGVHCAGMCGGIVGAVTTQLPQHHWPAFFHLSYNSGRIFSYSVAGALAGTLGQNSLALKDYVPVQQTLFAIASVMLILMGCYLAGFWQGVRHIEKVGGLLWKKIQPYSRSLLPVDSLPKAFGLGILWGWLPCGLTYTVLLSALAMGDALRGALVMLAFGIGTLPNLLAIGLFSSNVKKFVQLKPIRMSAGLLVAGLGVYGLYKLWVTGMAGWELFCHTT